MSLLVNNNKPIPHISTPGSRGRTAHPAQVGSTCPAPARAGARIGPDRRWRAFALLAVAFFMTIVDLTIVNVALPTIGRKLHFPEADLQWVVTAYAAHLRRVAAARRAGR